MKEQYRSRSAQQAIAHLIEECGETIQAAGKLLRWGPHSVNPELPPDQQETNVEWLDREMADLELTIKEARRLMHHDWHFTTERDA